MVLCVEKLNCAHQYKCCIEHSTQFSIHEGFVVEINIDFFWFLRTNFRRKLWAEIRKNYNIDFLPNLVLIQFLDDFLGIFWILNNFLEIFWIFENLMEFDDVALNLDKMNFFLRNKLFCLKKSELFEEK